MKKLRLLSVMLILTVVCSCGESGKQKNDKNLFGDEKYNCRGENYSSDSSFIIARGEGSSQNQRIASSKARMAAHANLAAKVSEYKIKVWGFTDENSYQESENGTTRHVVNEQLRNVRTVCTETRQEADLYITVYVVEMAVADIVDDDQIAASE